MALPLSNERATRLREIQRTRLGGIDRIVLDQLDDEPLLRYAHVYENGMGTNLHTTDDPAKPDDAYAEGLWRRVGVIDLDTGEVVDV